MRVAEIAAQLARIGVASGDTLLVHSSFRAVRPVEGGPAGLIAALEMAVGHSGTLAMPCWTGDDDSVFDPAGTPADPELGVVPDTFWRLSDVRRADHPIAFAARGPLADRLVADPMALPPHGPGSTIERLVEADGKVLLLGTGQDSSTTIHFAELAAGVPYSRAMHLTVAGPDGPRRVDYLANDCCCQRFALVDEWLKAEGAVAIGRVGQATTRLMRARDIVRIVTERLRTHPLAFLHAPDRGCAECDDARASLPEAEPPARPPSARPAPAAGS